MSGLAKGVTVARRFGAAALIAGVAALSGCAQLGDRPDPRADGRPRITVQPGDTVYGIARRHGVVMDELIRINRLEPPYLLQVGDQLILPWGRLHRVRPGDTLYGLAVAYGVEVAELARINGLAAPFTIRVGEPLRLPAGARAVPRPAPRPTVRRDRVDRAPLAPPRPPPPARPAVASAEVPAAPPVDRAPVQPKPAVVLPPPGPAVPTGAGAARAPAPAPTNGDAPPADAAATPMAVAAAATAGAGLPRPAAKPEVPLSLSSGGFRWPLRGTILSGFGDQEDGARNDGINIAAAAGTPVRAADDGIVAYAGNELRGYGNLLLIRHADSWMSAYAHVGRLLVDRGQRVRRGQPIATVGQTGSVGSPQLHFELRRDGQPVAPTTFMEQ